MANSETILITGGAGYIGSVLTKKLVKKGYNVKILDSLIYGKIGISHLLSNNSIELIAGDLRDLKLVDETLKGIDSVIHLAAIVGDPLCQRIPKAAKQINEIATKRLVKLCKKNGITRFIFASTCSNYGSSEDLVDESSPVNPLSLYSETKVNSESFILKSKTSDFEPCVLRFSTAFGISPKMRFDLLLQEFIRDALIENRILIFGPQYWRPLVHVDDISQACILGLRKSSDLISGEIYNVGDNNQNYKKITLAKMVKNFIPSTEIKIRDLKKDTRNYRVSFDKIQNNLGFKITKNVYDGIIEILDKIIKRKIDPRESEFSNISQMTEKVKAF